MSPTKHIVIDKSKNDGLQYLNFTSAMITDPAFPSTVFWDRPPRSASAGAVCSFTRTWSHISIARLVPVPFLAVMRKVYCWPSFRFLITVEYKLAFTVAALLHCSKPIFHEQKYAVYNLGEWNNKTIKIQAGILFCVVICTVYKE